MEVGRPLGPFDVVESLGRGGTASVYRAVERDTGRVVALKVLGTRVDPTTVRRFRGEAEILAGLDHPNIVKIYGAAEYDGLLVCALQYVAGSSLDRLVEAAGREGRTVPVPQAVSVVADLLSAVHYLEQLALCHRDLKPANVLVDPEGRALLADFGMARFRYRSHLTQDGYVLGTLRYMSPEQLRGEEVDHRSDLYQAGLVLYELLAGGLPFGDRNPYSQARLRCQQELPPPNLDLPGAGAALQGLLRRACARDRADRFQRAGEMLAALHEAVRPLDTLVHRRPLTEPPPELTERTRVLLSSDFRAPTPPVARAAGSARSAVARVAAAALAALALVAAVAWHELGRRGDPLAAVEQELAAGRVQAAALKLVAALDGERAPAQRADLERRRRVDLAGRVLVALPDGQGGRTFRELLLQHEAAWRREASEVLGELDRRGAAHGATAPTTAPPTAAAALARAAQDLSRLGLATQALEALRSALLAAPEDPELLRAVLRRSVALRRPGVVDLLTRLQKVDPAAPEVAAFEPWRRADRTGDAAAHLALALDLARARPDEALGPALAAPLLAAAGRHAEARPLLERGLELMPDHPGLRLLQARYLEREGRLAAACDAAVAAFMGDPVDAGYLIALLQLTDASGRYAAVAARLTAVRRVFLGEAALAFALVHVLAHEGRYEEVLAVLDEHLGVDKRTTLRWSVRAEQGGEVAGLAQNLEQLSYVTFHPQRLAALCALGRWEEVPRLVERILAGPTTDGPLPPEVLLWRSNGLSVAHDALAAALAAARAGQTERPVELHLYWGILTKTPFIARPCARGLAGLASGLLERLARARDEADAALRAAGQAPPGR